MKKYVAGFLFRRSDKIFTPDVALIMKRRGPANMAGKLNAIGGKIEEGEEPIQAMIREFKEETDVTFDGWELFCELRGKDWIVYFFKGWKDCLLKTMTDERVDWYGVHIFRNENYVPVTMKNLRWLVPMALDPDVQHSIIEDKT
jgi:8-oxo-dGTP diphosphatase